MNILVHLKAIIAGKVKTTIYRRERVYLPDYGKLKASRRDLPMKFEWNPNIYDDNHDFVPQFGGELVTLLAPEDHEIIFDLGCGTGGLTQEISAPCKKLSVLITYWR